MVTTATQASAFNSNETLCRRATPRQPSTALYEVSAKVSAAVSSAVSSFMSEGLAFSSCAMVSHQKQDGRDCESRSALESRFMNRLFIASMAAVAGALLVSWLDQPFTGGRAFAQKPM